MTDETPPPTRAVTLPALLEAINNGELELTGLMPWSSNYTFLGTITSAELKIPVVYKPQRGEQPLWDFPQGTLCKREVAAYVVSDALAWNLVPPTVLRDGPHGIGSVQLCIDTDYEQHYFTLRESHAGQFRRIALFDIVINNADRKGGHVLLDASDHIWGIDHGLAFHDEYKLRTVLWDWVGTPLEPDETAGLRELTATLEDAQPGAVALEPLLYPREVRAMRERTAALLKQGVFPGPRGPRSTPWPPL